MTPEAKSEGMSLAADIYVRRLTNREGIRKWYSGRRAAKAVKALERNGFSACFVDSKEEARQKILELVPDGAAVGAGGSITIREIGVLDVLKERGHRLYDHWAPGLTQEQVLAIRRAQLTCDVFLTSANAVTSDGRLVCCDGAGNRVAAMAFGPKKVVVAVGANKIVCDLDTALRRVKEVAAPQALRDTGIAVPCVETGHCQDCDSPQRGCRVTLILERKPYFTDIAVVVVGESLGF
ncbi:MAG: lactate utilization protein [Chloroflexota bacterium]